MAETNGSQTLIAVNTSDSSGELFTVVGFQQDVTFNKKNDLIDVSSKVSGRRTKYLLGRLDEEISLNFLYSKDDETYDVLRSAADRGASVQLMRQYNSTPGDDTLSNYNDLESCEAVITKLDEKHPDQKAAMVDMSAKVSGSWTPVSSGA